MATPAQNKVQQVMGIFLREAAHVAQILLAGQRVDHAARAQEQQRLEERVGHHVEDAGGKGAGAQADEHVAQLRNGRVGEDLLDVVLRQADGGGEERRRDADDGDDSSAKAECRKIGELRAIM